MNPHCASSPGGVIPPVSGRSHRHPLRTVFTIFFAVLLIAPFSAFAAPVDAVNTAVVPLHIRKIRTIKNDFVVTALAWHPDGRHLAMGQALNKRVAIWDVQTGMLVRTLDGESGGVSSLAYSPNGKYLAVGREFTRRTQDGTHVHLYEAWSGVLLRSFVPPSAPAKGDSNDANALIFSPNGRYLATNGYGGGAVSVVYHISTGTVVATLGPSTRARDVVESLAWSPDGRWIALGRISGRLELWSATSWKLEEYGDFNGHMIGALAFTPDGRRVVFGSFTRTVSDAELRRFAAMPEKIRTTLRAPTSVMQDLFVLDIPSLKVLSAYSSHDGSVIRALAFTPNGRFLVSGAAAKSVVVHDLSKGTVVLVLKDFKLPAYPALSKDGKRLAIATGEEVRIYDFIH